MSALDYFDRPFSPPLTSSVVVELYGEPVPKGRPRFGKGYAYTPDRTRNYELDLQWAAKMKMHGRPLFEGPLKVEILVALPIPNSWPQKRAAEAFSGLIRPTGRPDWDNYAKLACDALNKIVWRDDSQVVSAVVSKRYSDKPRLRIEIEPVIGEGA